MIEGEWGLQECRAGKGDDPDAVSRDELHEITHEKPRAFEAIRRHIGGEHAAGNIHGENDIPPGAFDFKFLPSAARTGQPEDNATQGEEQEEGPQSPAWGAYCSRKRGAQTTRHQLGDEMLTTPMGIPKPDGQ